MVNVDIVYRTVLLILNKEQRGYMTPDEFNSTATQVQLEIFNEYFDSLNQQIRIPDNDTEYADRVKNLQEKISIFQTSGVCVRPPNTDYFSIPNPTSFYKLGTVIYNDDKEVQYVQPNELLELNLSPITKPTKYWPVYTYKDSKINIYPVTITSGISCTYVRKPNNPEWNFTTGPYGEYLYSQNASTQFELHPTEQTNLVTKILLYSGIVIKDPQIIQVAAQQVQAENINSKS